MTKRLQAIGNSSGIIIDKPILELLRITPETELDISTDGERLIITPIHPTDLASKGWLGTRATLKNHERTFRKLADERLRRRSLLICRGCWWSCTTITSSLRRGSGSSGSQRSRVRPSLRRLDSVALLPTISFTSPAYAFHLAENQPFLTGTRRCAQRCSRLSGHQRLDRRRSRRTSFYEAIDLNLRAQARQARIGRPSSSARDPGLWLTIDDGLPDNKALQQTNLSVGLGIPVRRS